MHAIFKKKLIVDADVFANLAHSSVGQVSEFIDVSCIPHHRSVARILARFTNDPEVIAAALLHDTLKNAQTTLEDLRGRFGSRVASLVDAVSYHAPLGKINQAEGKGLESIMLEDICNEAKSIKLADVLYHIDSLDGSDPEFTKSYIVRKAKLMSSLVGGHPTLHSVTSKMIHGALAPPATRQRFSTSLSW